MKKKMPYSAVTQPLPAPLSQGGTFSSTVARHMTWVSPNRTRQEPSACLYFFCQAEDGIRSSSVTGVQTCALPICAGDAPARAGGADFDAEKARIVASRA